jgi:membrane glycosyltransferase
VVTLTPSIAPSGEASTRFLPARNPCEMPTQSLRQPSQAAKPIASSMPLTLKRLYMLFGTAALTALAAYEMYYVLEVGGITLLEALVLVLFVALFAWVAFSSLSSFAGFFVLLGRKPANLSMPPRSALPPLTGKTALLFPVYNEEPHAVFARVRAIHESVHETGYRDHFDIFLLSDTTDPDLWVLEEKLLLDVRRETGSTNIYYRHRTNNVARKSGNIQDWVTSFGGGYDHMIILDADSLMTGETIVRLACAMESHPRAGLIQTLPIIVNARTLFARLQPFAGRLYGPVIAAGIAWWHGSEGNYWGHNAIIRVRAFAENAGLPELPGRKPFGGHVLSHDFVEAALMRRGGWAIYMANAVGGSYEECPPTQVDYAARDRRWCQGNLQHLALLGTRGLHWVSRLHLLTGIGAYLTAPMWFAFLVLGIAISLQAQFVRPEYFPSGFSLFPKWPAQDPIRAIWVFAGTMMLLLVPKLLALVVVLANAQLRKGFGGGFRTSVGMMLETILSGLMAPAMMFFQSTAVAEILLGRDSGWQVQRRADGYTPRHALIRKYAAPTAVGVLMGVSAYLVSVWLLLWMTPVIVGLLLCIPIAIIASAPTAGPGLKASGVLATPEEVSPPSIMSLARAQLPSPEHERVDALTLLRADDVLREAHLANLPEAVRRRGQVDERLAVAMVKINQAERFEEAVSFLDAREKFALLSDANQVRSLLRKP